MTLSTRQLHDVLDKLPQRLQPRAKRALYEMMYAERAPARPPELASRRVSGQVPQGGGFAYCPLERLVTFFDFPAGHWKHLRTKNVIESPFATVRLRERATKGRRFNNQGPAERSSCST